MLPPEGFCPAPNKSLTIGLTPENSSYVIAKSLLVVVLSPLHWKIQKALLSSADPDFSKLLQKAHIETQLK